VTERRERLLAWLLVSASAAYLALGFAWGSTPDDEEYRISILTTLLHARALLAGTWMFWTSELGFGMPHPLGQSFVWHPLMPLLAAMRPDHWVVLLLLTHVAAGAAGMMHLGRLLALRPLVAATATATFLLASTTQNFLLTDFWPSAFFGWTLMPWVLGAMVRLLRATASRERRRAAALLALFAGLALANGHPGYMLVYGVPVATFLAAGARPALDRPGAWLLAIVLVLGLVAPLLVHLGPEVARFAPGLGRISYDNPIRLAGLWDLFVRPLPFVDGAGEWSRMMVDRGARIAFFGLPFSWLAVAGALVGRWRRGAYPGLVPAFVVSLALLATPGLSRLQVLPATALFRDPMILFGTLLAAGILNRLWTEGRSRLVGVLIALQIGTLAAAAWPFVAMTLDPLRRQPALASVTPGPIVTWLSREIAGRPGRLYYSTDVDRMMNAGQLFQQGLWRLTPAFHGLRVINGSYKGISQDEFSPDPLLPYSNIESVPPLQLSAASMATVGISHVLARVGEPIASELSRVSELTTADGVQLVLYENPGVTGAVVLPRAIVAEPTPLLDQCPHTRLLCRDFSRVWSSRDASAKPQLSGRDGRLSVEIARTAAQATLVVGELYRREWTASAAGRALTVRPAFGGLLAVDLPEDATQVALVYRPRLRMAANALAAAALLAIAWLLR